MYSRCLSVIIFALFFCISDKYFVFAKQHIDHTYPEITDEEIIEFQNKFVIETSETEKKYLEPVIKPENFDLNKDRKISKEEIKKALIYIFYPKDPKKLKELPPYFDQHIKNNIDLFVKNIKLDFLNFKQFSYLMRKINLYNFFDHESIASKQRAEKAKIYEGESEL